MEPFLSAHRQPTGYATGLQEFLAGTPTGGSQRQGNTDRNTFENSHAGYIQDSFHWKKNVTLNFGLRYDYFGIVQEKHGNFTNVDTATGLGVLVGQAPSRTNRITTTGHHV